MQFHLKQIGDAKWKKKMDKSDEMLIESQMIKKDKAEEEELKL